MLGDGFDSLLYWFLIDASFFDKKLMKEGLEKLKERCSKEKQFLQEIEKNDNYNTSGIYFGPDVNSNNNRLLNKRKTKFFYDIKLLNEEIQEEKKNNNKKGLNHNNINTEYFHIKDDKTDSSNEFSKHYKIYNNENNQISSSSSSNNDCLNQESEKNENKSNNIYKELKEKVRSMLEEVNKINTYNINKLEEKVKKFNQENKYQLMEDSDKNNLYRNGNESLEYTPKFLEINPLYENNPKCLELYDRYMEYLYNRDIKLKNLSNEESSKNDKKTNSEKYSNGSENENKTNDIDKEMEIENENENEESESYSELVCCVCNNGDIIQNQLMLECEGCHVTVHQGCYGVSSTENIENWKCEACRMMSSNKVKDLECILCSVKGGALKRIDLPQNSFFYKTIYEFKHHNPDSLKPYKLPETNYNIIIPKTDYSKINCAWVHLSCALWNPNIQIGNFELKNNIKLVDHIPFKNFNSLCNICNKNNYGPTLKCNNSNCNFQCHPECARFNNYCMEVEIVKQHYQYNIYCSKHSPNIYAKKLNKITKNNISEAVEFNKELKKLFEIYKRENGIELIQKKNEQSDIEINIKQNKEFDINNYNKYNLINDILDLNNFNLIKKCPNINEIKNNENIMKKKTITKIPKRKSIGRDPNNNSIATYSIKKNDKDKNRQKNFKKNDEYIKKKKSQSPVFDNKNKNILPKTTNIKNINNINTYSKNISNSNSYSKKSKNNVCNESKISSFNEHNNKIRIDLYDSEECTLIDKEKKKISSQEKESLSLKNNLSHSFSQNDNNPKDNLKYANVNYGNNLQVIINNQKETFIEKLIIFLDYYTKQNRLIAVKGEEFKVLEEKLDKEKSEDEESDKKIFQNEEEEEKNKIKEEISKNPIKSLSYRYIKELINEIPNKEMEEYLYYKKEDVNEIFSDLFPNKDEFEKLFFDKIESVLINDIYRKRYSMIKEKNQSSYLNKTDNKRKKKDGKFI